MEKAVEIDPDFAMAYRSLAMSYGNLSFFNEEKNHIEKALDLADRLPNKERYQIMGDYYGTTEKTYDKSIEAYQKLLELYPDDTTANHNLGLAYYNLAEWDKAIERYKTAVKQNTRFVGTYTQLAAAYRAKQMYPEAKETLESYLSRFGEHELIRRGMAYLYVNQDRLDLAQAEAEKAFLLDPNDWENFQLKGDLYLYQGDLEKAEEEYQNMLKGREPAGQGTGRAGLANLYEYQGRFESASKMWEQNIAHAQQAKQRTWESWCFYGLAYSLYYAGNLEEALKACEQALNMTRETDDLGYERLSLYLKGLILLETGSISKAQNTAEELKTLIEKGLDRKIIRLYHGLAGLIEFKKKNFSRAITQFQKALDLESYGPLSKSADTISLLASAYHQSGNPEKAVEEYKRIHQLNTGRRGSGPVYVKSFYRLGKIYQEMGETEKAIEHYEKFLDLWKDADPGIAEVEDAKKRLAGLMGTL
jgi:tetratricopeptide (TPR) repeat protein